MTPEVFATTPLRQRDQHEAWREWFRPMFEVMARGHQDGGFLAKNTVWRLDGIAVSRVNAPAVSVTRTLTHIRRNPIDHWVLSYCERGEITFRTERGSLQCRSGAPFLWSLGQTHEAVRNDTTRIQLFLSRDAFQDIAPLLDAACGVVLDTSLGRLLGDFILSLERQLPDLAISDAPRVKSALRALIAACVAPPADRIGITKDQLNWGRRERVRQEVRAHLHQATLTPETLCRAVGMSRSNLYRLLEDDGGVVNYIRRQRLLEAYKMLTDSRLTRTVSAIAEGLGFADASSFSRAFRIMFGQSPTETRAAAIAGVVLPLTPDKISTAGEPRFSSFLQGL